MTLTPTTYMPDVETFECKGCGHELPMNFCMRTPGYCYLCDPKVTVKKLLDDYDAKHKPTKTESNQ